MLLGGCMAAPAARWRGCQARRSGKCVVAHSTVRVHQRAFALSLRIDFSRHGFYSCHSFQINGRVLTFSSESYFWIVIMCRHKCFFMYQYIKDSHIKVKVYLYNDDAGV